MVASWRCPDDDHVCYSATCDHGARCDRKAGERLKPHRRPDFDAIVTGWGADSLDDLMARCELMRDFWAANLSLLPAEHKIAKAMTTRLLSLGGISPFPELN